jgi:putative aminopeptidase FrvX
VEKQTPNLSPLRAGTKRQGSNGAKMLRKYGTAARAAARKETGIVSGMHGAPEFYMHGITRPARPARLVKKG